METNSRWIENSRWNLFPIWTRRWVCLGERGLFLFAAFEKLRNIEHKGDDDSEDGGLDDVIVNRVMKFDMSEDGANKKVEKRPDDKTDDKSSD